MTLHISGDRGEKGERGLTGYGEEGPQGIQGPPGNHSNNPYTPPPSLLHALMCVCHLCTYTCSKRFFHIRFCVTYISIQYTIFFIFFFQKKIKKKSRSRRINNVI